MERSLPSRQYPHPIPSLNDFWVNIAIDPKVVEVQAKPSTVEELHSVKSLLDHLFDSAESVGLQPHEITGGGHIHMDFVDAFGDDARLFRNWIVDSMNHQELGSPGVLGTDIFNAPHLATLGKEQQKEFEKVIREFDEGKIKSARALADAINTRVYVASNSHPSYAAVKYQAYNLTRSQEPDGEATVEFRAISPQKNADEFLQQTALFEARLEHLKKQDGYLQLLDFRPMSKKEKIRAYRAYVEESGMDWREYRETIRVNANLASDTTKPLSLSSFHSREEIQSMAKTNQCESFFKKISKIKSALFGH